MCSRVHLNFAVILSFFLPCDFRSALPLFFEVLSLASSPFLAIVIRYLLYVPDYVVGRLNSSYISLSLQLAEYNSQLTLITTALKQ